VDGGISIRIINSMGMSREEMMEGIFQMMLRGAGRGEKYHFDSEFETSQNTVRFFLSSIKIP